MDNQDAPILPPRKTRAAPIIIGTLAGAFIAAGGTFLAMRHQGSAAIVTKDGEISTLTADLGLAKKNVLTLNTQLNAASTQICRHGLRDYVVQNQNRLIGRQFNIHAEQVRENGDVVCQGQMVTTTGQSRLPLPGRPDPTVPFTFTISPKDGPVLVCDCLR